MARDDDWDGLVVLCAANNWDAESSPIRHMAERLTAHAPVLYVDPPISHLTRSRTRRSLTSVRRPHLRRRRPAARALHADRRPEAGAPGDDSSSRSGSSAGSCAAPCAQLGGRVHAVIATWVFPGCLRRLRRSSAACTGGRTTRRRRRVLGAAPSVRKRREAPRPRRGTARPREERLARSSDLIVAVNEGAVARWLDRGLPAAYLPNGCDAPYFATVDENDAAADVSLRGPVAGFVGHINSRTDLALLEAVADAGHLAPADRTQGPRLRAGALRASARSGATSPISAPRPFDELPSYLKLIDVGLVPTRTPSSIATASR